MPKEQIYGEALPYGTPEDPGPARSVVEVRWDRETGYFQIASKCIEASTGEDYLPPFEPIAAEVVTGRELTEADFTELTVEGPMRAQSGWYVDLDRRGINELIRVLRRARDQAFGRDE